MNRIQCMQSIDRILNEVLNVIQIKTKEDTTLQELGIDSIGFMTLIVYLEKEYGEEIILSHELLLKPEEIKIKNIIDAVVQSSKK